MTKNTKGLVQTVITYSHNINTYLQVGPYKRLASGVVEVALHEEVEQMCGVAADGAQLGVAALEDFITERGTHVGPAVKEGAGELEDTRGETGGNTGIKEH